MLIICSIIFESNVLVVYLCFQIYFLIDYHCKTSIRNFFGVECFCALCAEMPPLKDISNYL